ncbi:MAG: hypothetical protein IT211_11525 [Armatimonadetes bacterium]|nr:hypothetical protein [Armatimonadota bacterium]
MAVASGDYSTVSGGYLNTASGQYSAIGGGQNGAAVGDYSAVGGGYSNTALGSAANSGRVITTSPNACNRQTTMRAGAPPTEGFCPITPSG